MSSSLFLIWLQVWLLNTGELPPPGTKIPDLYIYGPPPIYAEPPPREPRVPVRPSIIPPRDQVYSSPQPPAGHVNRNPPVAIAPELFLFGL